MQKKIILNILVLWLITFAFIIPLFAQRWIFSPLCYMSEDYKKNAANLVDKLNAERYDKASEYLKTLNVELNKNEHIRRLAEASIVSVVVTKQRQVCYGKDFDCEPHYLQQVVAGIDRESKLFFASKYRNETFSPVLICSVDPQWKQQKDLTDILSLFPAIFRYKNDLFHISESSRAKETQDYAFCLDQSISSLKQKPRYLLMFEDDVVVFPNFFSTIVNILENKIEEQSSVRGTTAEKRCWIKLYFPEFWAGFAWEISKILELIIIALVGGILGCIGSVLILYHQRRKLSILTWFLHGSLYLLTIALLVSRQTLLELLRIHPSLLNVSQFSGCCTQAVLYNTECIPNIVKFIRSPECQRCKNGVDLGLVEFGERENLKNRLVQPNLVQHIGMHSTVTKNKNAVSMLFHDVFRGNLSGG